MKIEKIAIDVDARYEHPDRIDEALTRMVDALCDALEELGYDPTTYTIEQSMTLVDEGDEVGARRYEIHMLKKEMDYLDADKTDLDMATDEEHMRWLSEQRERMVEKLRELEEQDQGSVRRDPWE